MTRLYTLCAVLCLVAGPMATADITDGLVARYALDGDAQDSSGHNRHGTVHGAMPTQDQHGKANAAYAFDGVDDYIAFGPVLPDMTNMTLSLWVKAEVTGSGRTVFSDGQGLASGTVRLNINSGNQIGVVANKEGMPLNNNVEINVPMAQRWRHVVWVVTPYYTSVYIDANELALIEKGGSNRGQHNFVLGAEVGPSGQVGTSGFWKGLISSLGIYDRALSDEEIKTLYGQDIPSGTADTLWDGLVAYYPFDGHAKDESGNNLNGTLVGPTPARDQDYQEGAALEFDGVDDYINVGPSLPDAQQMSVAFWMYNETAASDNIWADPAILCDGDSAAGQDLEIAIDKKGGVYLRADKAGKSLNHTFTSDVTFFKTWRHVVWLIASTYSDLYVDGKQIMRINAGGSNVGNHGFCIGTIISMGNSPGWNGYWKGRLSSLRMYRRLLSDKEIQQLYELERCVENDYRATASLSDMNGNQAPELLSLTQDPVSRCPAVLIKDSLTAETLKTVPFIEITPIPPLAQGLVAYFPFDGNATSTVSPTGKSYKGTVKGATLTQDQNGKANGAYSLDGVDDCVYFGPVLPDMMAMTIAMWVYDSGNPWANRTLFCDGDWQGGNDVRFSTTQGRVWLTANKGGSGLDQELPVPGYTFNQWLHVTWTLSTSGSTIYIGGQKAASTDVGGSNVGYHDFIIGTEEYPQGSLGWRGYWKGKISSLRIYNRVLTADEVRAVYLEEANANEVRATGLEEVSATTDVEYKGLALVSLRDSEAAQTRLGAALIRRETTGEYLVEVRNLLTGAHVNRITFLSADHQVYGLAAVPDMSGDGIDDLSVMGKNRVTGEVVHEIRDTLTGAVIRTVPFPR